jgi:thymidylate kinase
MSTYLIEGISGTGKSAVCHELRKRGYRALEADEAFGFYGDPKTGEITKDESQLNWMWNRKKVNEELGAQTGEPVFVCGGAMNQHEFVHYFEKTFTLHVDDDTLRERLLSRTSNDFGKQPDDLARQLEWNKGAVKYSKQRGTTLVDATRPIDDVAADILRHIKQ